jgi:hypothetical protein
MKRLERNMEDPESRAFWQRLEARVASFMSLPDWLREAAKGSVASRKDLSGSGKKKSSRTKGGSMTIEELCERSYTTAVNKGWHEEPRSFGEVTSLFHSEVSEALECWRDPAHTIADVWESESGKPEGFVVELADLLIRIGDTCVETKIPLAKVLNNTTISMLGYGMEDAVQNAMRTVPEWLAYIHACLSRAFEDFILDDCDRGGTREEQASVMLAKAIVTVGTICRLNGLDLEASLIKKMDHNDTRPHRHGGKRG